MKKFLKDPYNIALLGIVGAFIVCLIIAQFVNVFVSISLLIVGLLCFYLSLYIYRNYKKQEKQEDIDEFFPNKELKERKKTSLIQQENKINRMFFVYGLLIFGVMFVYLFIKML